MNMRKIIVTVVVAAIMLAGCGTGATAKEDVAETVSNVTIQEFENQVIGKIDNSRTVDVKEEDGRKTFSAQSDSTSDSYHSQEWEFTGEANSDDMISSLTMVIAADGDYYKELTMEEFVRLTVEDDMGSLTWSELQSLMGLNYFAYAVQLFSGDSSSDAWTAAITLLFEIRESEKTVNGWKYSADAKSEEIIFSAEYVGE